MNQVGIDANVLLRALLHDSPEQSAASRAFLETLDPEKRGYVGITALLEVFWVLDRRNRVPRDRVAAAFDMLLTLEFVEFESFDCIRRAIAAYSDGGVDFPDVLLAERNREAGCATTMTFDNRAAQRIPSMGCHAAPACAG
jgi:predicted nucleic-acid-binding protein